jgi:vacuolar-type H+-ATPase subunit E/Vma4
MSYEDLKKVKADCVTKEIAKEAKKAERNAKKAEKEAQREAKKAAGMSTRGRKRKACSEAADAPKRSTKSARTGEVLDSVLPQIIV